MVSPFPLHGESEVLLQAPAEEAFAWLDDFHNLAAHMERPSGMMMGSAMRLELDAAEGRSVGSRVRMSGVLLGISLAIEEVVVEREPPRRKTWETIDANLLVIGQYRLGFELSPQGTGTRLRVRIDYALPARLPERWLGRLLGGTYARWCTNRMARDAERNFAGVAVAWDARR